MQSIAARLLAAALVAVLSIGVGYGLGLKIERGRWLQLETDRQDAAAETARIAAAAETRRGVASQQKRDRVAARVQVIARGYDALPATCMFSGDELRLLNAERDAYLDAGPAPVSDAVPSDAGDPAQRPADGAKSHGMGLRLPISAERVHRLDRKQ